MENPVQCSAQCCVEYTYANAAIRQKRRKNAKNRVIVVVRIITIII